MEKVNFIKMNWLAVEGNMPNPREQLINLAISELTKVFQDLREGKEPKISPEIEKLTVSLEQSNTKMSEEQVNNFAEQLIKDLSNK